MSCDKIDSNKVAENMKLMCFKNGLYCARCPLGVAEGENNALPGMQCARTKKTCPQVDFFPLKKMIDEAIRIEIQKRKEKEDAEI